MVDLKKISLIGGSLGIIAFFIPAYFGMVQDADIGSGYTLDLTMIFMYFGLYFATYNYSPSTPSGVPTSGAGFSIAPFLLLVGVIGLIFAIYLIVKRNNISSKTLIIFGAVLLALTSLEMLFEFIAGMNVGLGVSLTLIPIAPIIYVVIGVILFVSGIIER